MASDKKIKDVMVGIFEYPHIPYWFSIDQAMRIIKVSFISTKKYPEPLAILVFDEKYNLLGTLTLRDILRGLEPKFMRTPTEKVFRFAVLAVGGMCAVLAAGGSVLITALFGIEFEGSVVSLWCLIPGILFFSLWTILNNDLGARGMPMIVIVAPALALFVNIGGNVLLFDRWGIAGSAASASLASLVGLSLVLCITCVDSRYR